MDRELSVIDYTQRKVTWIVGDNYGLCIVRHGSWIVGNWQWIIRKGVGWISRGVPPKFARWAGGVGTPPVVFSSFHTIDALRSRFDTA